MRILSIDWDYFVNASYNERMELFPDTPNDKASTELSKIIWSSVYAGAKTRHYLYNTRDIEDIDANNSALKYISKLLNNSDFVYLTEDSHKWLGDFLLNPDTQEYFNDLYLDDTSLDDLEIVNIDHHSDLYNIGIELNCGNWLNKVMEKYENTKVLWVANKDSRCDELENLAYQNRVSVSRNLKDVTGRFDMVYLCRSAQWSPPHLDRQYDEFDRKLRKQSLICLSDGFLPIRWDKNMQDTIEQHYKMNLTILENKKKATSFDSPFKESEE